MRLLIKTLFIWSFTTAALAVTDEAIDYRNLSQSIKLNTLRAGNHDASGHNDYYFTITVHALASTPEEQHKDFKDRQKVSLEPKNFGELKLDALSFWQQDNDVTVQIDGDEIRRIVAEAMTKFQLREDQVSIAVELQMFEQSKKWLVLSNDLLVGREMYFVLQETAPRLPTKKAFTLQIEDKVGTKAVFQVNYVDPHAKVKKKS